MCRSSVGTTTSWIGFWVRSSDAEHCPVCFA
jgi:hypothetical protein